MPDRIQRRRTAGWRMPAGAVSIARPGMWGNPYRVGHEVPLDWHWNGLRWVAPAPESTVQVDSPAQAVDLFQRIAAQPLFRTAARTLLRGKTLACWCPVGAPCHGDALLAIANGGPDV